MLLWGRILKLSQAMNSSMLSLRKDIVRNWHRVKNFLGTQNTAASLIASKIQTSIWRLWTFRIGLALAGMRKNLFRVSFYVARKATNFVFKLGQHDDINPISISAEDAFGLFEADESEKPLAVSNQFEPVYQAVKARLFKDIVDTEAERSRREAFSIIKAWMKNKILSSDYLEDLLLLMRNDGLTRRGGSLYQQVVH